jgi:hypothetical protein
MKDPRDFGMDKYKPRVLSPMVRAKLSSKDAEQAKPSSSVWALKGGDMEEEKQLLTPEE